MHIQRVRIQNVRCLESVELDFRHEGAGSLAGWTVIAGPNGAGKSALLQSIALALAGPQNAPRLMENYSAWVRLGALEASVLVTLSSSREAPEPWHDQLLTFSDEWTTDTLSHEVLMDPVDVEVTWRRDDARTEPLIAFQTSPLHTAGSLRVDVPASIWRPLTTLDFVVCGYGPFRRLSGTSEAARQLRRGLVPVARLISLFREDVVFSDAVAWLQDVHLRALEGKPGAAALKAQALDLLNDGLLPGGTTITRVDSDGLWTHRDDTGEVLLQQLSDGYRAVIALVLDLLRNLIRPDEPMYSGPPHRSNLSAEAVVLIDEVDTHLHPSWQKQIGFWLTAHFPNIQFIVTTHSPFICQAASPGGLWVLPAPGSSEGARRLEGESFWRVVNGSADEAVLSSLFGLERAHSERSERLRAELAALEVKLLDGSADEADVTRYSVIRGMLPAPDDALLRALASRP